jgi:transcriptional regulator with XRE-family HTH domain
MGIGKKLEQLLEANNMNANELARKINVSPQTIYSMIKRDSKKADIEVLLKIADIFGVNAEYFVYEQKPVTIAAHFDGNEYTKEELDEIRQFAEFVKNKRQS